MKDSDSDSTPLVRASVTVLLSRARHHTSDNTDSTVCRIAKKQDRYKSKLTYTNQ